MKKEARSRVSELIKPNPVDPSAETTKELAQQWCVGIATASRYVADLLKEGRIEAVRKKVGTRMVNAYRTVK